MSLTDKKSVTLFGESIIEANTVAQLNATVDFGEFVSTTYSETIVNQELYRTNRAEVRKDISDFKDKVYELEDSSEVKAK